MQTNLKSLAHRASLYFISIQGRGGATQQVSTVFAGLWIFFTRFLSGFWQWSITVFRLEFTLGYVSINRQN